jgi:hypothetical protein
VKKTALILMTLFSPLLWGETASFLSFSLRGEWDGDDSQLASLLEWDISGGLQHDYELFLSCESSSLTLDGDDNLYRLGLAFTSPFVSLGSLSTSGLYNMIESDDFLSFSSLMERGRISLDKDSDITERKGLLLSNKEKNLLIHCESREDYLQTGLLVQPFNEGRLSWSSLFAYTWGRNELEDEESWYPFDEGDTDEALAHGLLRLRFTSLNTLRDWHLFAAGSCVLSPLLLPGYGGYLTGELRDDRFALDLSIQYNGGHWRNTSGKPSQWSRGLSWKGDFFRERLIGLEIKGALYYGGVFSVEPGIKPWEKGVIGEGELLIRGPFFQCEWKGNRNPLESSREQSFEANLFAHKGDAKGAFFYKEKWDVLTERRIKTEFKWDYYHIDFEGQVGWYFYPSQKSSWDDLFWRAKVVWSGNSKGLMTMILKYEEGEMAGEMVFLLGKL